MHINTQKSSLELGGLLPSGHFTSRCITTKCLKWFVVGFYLGYSCLSVCLFCSDEMLWLHVVVVYKETLLSSHVFYLLLLLILFEFFFATNNLWVCAFVSPCNVRVCLNTSQIFDSEQIHVPSSTNLWASTHCVNMNFGQQSSKEKTETDQKKLKSQDNDLRAWLIIYIHFVLKGLQNLSVHFGS